MVALRRVDGGTNSVRMQFVVGDLDSVSRSTVLVCSKIAHFLQIPHRSFSSTLHFSVVLTTQPSPVKVAADVDSKSERSKMKGLHRELYDLIGGRYVLHFYTFVFLKC